MHLMSFQEGIIFTICNIGFDYPDGLSKRFDMYMRATQGFPEPTVVMAGNSAEISSYDGWQLRYIWSKIKDETNSSGKKRFN